MLFSCVFLCCVLFGLFCGCVICMWGVGEGDGVGEIDSCVVWLCSMCWKFWVEVLELLLVFEIGVVVVEVLLVVLGSGVLVV